MRVLQVSAFLYTNDLHDVLSDERIEHILYADDLQVYAQFVRRNSLFDEY